METQLASTQKSIRSTKRTHRHREPGPLKEGRQGAGGATSGGGAAGGEKHAEATVLLTNWNDYPQDSNCDVVTYQVVIARS